MEITKTPSTARENVTFALAVIGFVALIGASLWLASYSTRFVPGIVNRFGAATVYLGTLFNGNTPPTLTVIDTPVATTTPVTEATTTTPVATSSPVIKIPTKTPTTPGSPTSGTYPIGGAPATGLYGYPDLTVTLTSIGYLATTSADSFVANGTVPVGGRPAVKFTIKNTGTNVSAPWRFSASIPTSSGYIFQSQPQQQLAPGESIDYTLGFDQANKGSGQMVSVTANYDHAVTESNLNNNSASAYLTILGS